MGTGAVWGMGQCFNPSCLYENPEEQIQCQRCGTVLRLCDRYRATRCLGMSRFACTFAAIDEHRLHTACVIKQFLPQEKELAVQKTAMNLFKQEALILRDLGMHSQIPALLAFFEYENRFYLVQDYVEGHNLLEELRQSGPFSEQQVWQVLLELLPILQFVHERDVIHRDIKLSNVIRPPTGDLVLIDFGGSRLRSASFGSITGTPGYAPPEQLKGEVCPASDLYSLGVLCLRLLTGAVAQDGADFLFSGSTPVWDWQALDLNLTPSLQVILDQLLQPDLTDRYRSAAETYGALLTNRPTTVELTRASFRDHTPQLYGTRGRNHGRFQRLEKLLVDQNYSGADQETWLLLLRLGQCEAAGRLTLWAINELPLAELKQIDHLWLRSSQGRFGFTVQQRIYHQFGGSVSFDYPVWQLFGQQVSWCMGAQWRTYTDLMFSSQAPMGHLPACWVDVRNRQGGDRGVCGWWRLGFALFMQRLMT